MGTVMAEQTGKTDVRPFVHLDELRIENRHVDAYFSVSPDLERFVRSGHALKLEYSEDVSGVPPSILVIPFVANILPFVWLTDAVLELDELDERFHQCIPHLKEGYVAMSPKLDFRGEVHVRNIVHNDYEPGSETACLFSGGADAFSLLLAHVGGKPTLVTLLGADVSPENETAMSFLRRQALSAAEQYGLPAPVLVRTNLRDFLMLDVLNEHFRKQDADLGWWHDMQHGIGIISHAAPVAYIHKWGTLYIASSYTVGRASRCASDPSIDNHVKLCRTNVVHDQFGLTRQDKIRLISSAANPPSLHVCLHAYDSCYGGENCCTCEKCLRTIFGLLAEGADPARFGFPAWRDGAEMSKGFIRRRLSVDSIGLAEFWKDIRTRIRETGAYRQDKAVNWIYAENAFRLTFCEKVYDKIRGRLRYVKYLLCLLRNRLCRRG